MASQKIEELRLDVLELNSLLGQAERKKVKDVLSIEVRKIETEITKLREIAEAEATGDKKHVAAAITKPKCYEVKLTNYGWDQSDKFVKIFINLKDVHTLEEANVFCKFTNSSVEVNAKGLDNRNYQLPIKNLLEELDVDKSYWKVKTDNIVVFMAKKKVGSKWSHMTSSEKKSVEAKAPKLKDGKADDPSAGLMDMMKQMYDDGDDEMKRTIAKAWTESREKGGAGGPMMPGF